MAIAKANSHSFLFNRNTTEIQKPKDKVLQDQFRFNKPIFVTKYVGDYRAVTYLCDGNIFGNVSCKAETGTLISNVKTEMILVFRRNKMFECFMWTLVDGTTELSCLYLG